MKSVSLALVSAFVFGNFIPVAHASGLCWGEVRGGVCFRTPPTERYTFVILPTGVHVPGWVRDFSPHIKEYRFPLRTTLPMPSTLAVNGCTVSEERPDPSEAEVKRTFVQVCGQ